jgi:YidC/Oxa1 family membrane protein insertase
MGMDKNTIIGFALIGVLMIGMFYFNSKGNQTYLADQKRVTDSIARLKPKADPAKLVQDSLAAENLRKTQSSGGFPNPTTLTEQPTIVENEVFSIQFTNKGAQPQKVTLKKYKTYNGKQVVIQQGGFNKINYKINSSNNVTANTADMIFAPAEVTTNADQSKTVRFSLKDTTGKEVVHQYTIHPNSYLIDFAIQLNGASQLISSNTLSLNWQVESEKIEKSIVYERQQTQINYIQEGKYDFESIGTSDNSLALTKPVDWVSVKQQFFIQALAAKNKFQSADIAWKLPDTAKQIIAQTTGSFKLPVTVTGNKAAIDLQLFYAPSDYTILNAYNNEMQNIVPYGNGIFAFVKYINRHFLLPVFDYIRQHVASMGIVILLLTLFIRLLTSPILYKSYVSGAKMKALKPEIDALKAKFGDDQQGFGMEQMKLWKSAGVNPLGGCIPALLQIPIFMSLYYFFQSNISLRGEKFLWATDLAAYDTIYNIPFEIPLYGDHISLFTLTATITSLLISVYSMSQMQDNSNPVMKYMPYIFPVMLLGVFNGLPSALTWYYTISNSITLLLQIVIQKYIINHDKILAEIEENKKRPVKQSKLQERIQAMQEANKKMQDARGKGK